MSQLLLKFVFHNQSRGLEPGAVGRADFLWLAVPRRVLPALLQRVVIALTGTELIQLLQNQTSAAPPSLCVLVGSAAHRDVSVRPFVQK